MTHACPPSRLLPLLEPLEPRLLLTAALSINDVGVLEGNAGATLAVFTVTLSQAIAADATVNWATADGTATVADNDYVAASGVLTILAGQTTGSITVYAKSDTTYETDETFTVTLSNPVNATLGAKTQGIATIQNDDAPITLTINDVSATEGNAATKNWRNALLN